MSTVLGAVPEVAALPPPVTAVTPTAAKTLDYFPIGMFGSVMSLTILTVAWRLAQPLLGTPPLISEVLQYLSTAALVLVGACYLIKCVTAPQAVGTEFNHPIVGNLFGTFLISLLLQPIVIVQWSPLLARAMWTVGAVGMVTFAWLVVTRWLTQRQKIEHATPAWIVPVVGMLDVPLALPALGLAPMHGVSVLCLAVGLFFAVPLFTMIMMRLVFEEPMPNLLAPTLLILVAPFSVGVSTYLIAGGQIDMFAQALYALDLFVLATLFGRLRYLMGCCPFRVSWWAAGFPMGTSAIAGLRIAAANPSSVNLALAILLLVLASGLIVFLTVRTLVGVFDGELRHLSGP